MASSKEFVAYVCDQLALAGSIVAKSMFGEYGLYCDGKFFGVVEDDQFYGKITQAGKGLLENPVVASPHEGARYFLIENLDDREFLREFVQKTCAELPAPKQKKRKTRGAQS